MIGIELLEKYPKAGEVIKAWYVQKMIESFNNPDLTDGIPQDFLDSFKTMGVKNEEVAPMIDANPSALFHLFDTNEILIQINVSKTFSYSINEGEIIAGGWDTRKKADFAAVVQAFELLNRKLEQ